jgi:lipopolysaccharide exporter
MADTVSTPDTSSAQAPTTRPKTSFAGDVLKLVSGTAFAQLLGILASPILTRLYTPEAFGVLAIFTSITAIIGVITCLRYELAIMLPESDEEAANLLGVSLISAAFISLLTGLVIWWSGDILLRWLNAPSLAPYLWLAPVAVLFSGIFTALNYWNSRTKQFGRLSIARVMTSLVTTTGQLGAGLAGFATGGIMIGASVGGSILATTVLGGQIWRDDKNLLRRAVYCPDMFAGIKRYRKFPLYDTWSALLNTISWQLPVFLMSSFFSSTIVGFYALGFRILQLPMSLIGGSIAQVFYQRASEAHKQNRLTALVEDVFDKLVIIGLFPMLTLTLTGRDLYIVLFGAEWAEAGVYTQILSIWAFIWFISSPLSTLFGVLEKQEYLLWWNLANFVTRFLSLWMGGVLREPRIAIILFASSGILVYGYITLLILRKSGVSLRKVTKIIGRNFMIFLPTALILMLLMLIHSESLLRVWVASILITLYFLYVLKKQPQILHFFYGNLRKASNRQSASDNNE